MYLQFNVIKLKLAKKLVDTQKIIIEFANHSFVEAKKCSIATPQLKVYNMGG